MDSKNVLLVVASVSLFLVIVLAAGMWLFWPQTGDNQTVAAAEPLFPETEPFDTFEYYRGRQELPGLVEQPEDMTITVGEAPEPAQVAVTPRSEEPARTPEVPAAPRPVQTTARETVSAPATPRPATPRPSTATPVAAVRPAQTAPAKVREYWIQAGSYKSRTRAETLYSKLTGLGIGGTIQTRDLEGVMWFRVRIGPYTNMAEAQKFLDTVKTIDGLEKSYISQVTRTRS
jgi:cell division protein FtsN